MISILYMHGEDGEMIKLGEAKEIPASGNNLFDTNSIEYGYIDCYGNKIKDVNDYKKFDFNYDREISFNISNINMNTKIEFFKIMYTDTELNNSNYKKLYHLFYKTKKYRVKKKIVNRLHKEFSKANKNSN